MKWTPLFASTIFSLALIGCGGPQGGPAPEPGPPVADPPSPAKLSTGWTQWGGSATRTRSSEEAGPASAPGIAWSGLIEGELAAEPVLGVAGSRRLAIVAGLNALVAIDCEDGREAWTSALPGSVSSSPVVVGDRLWLGSQDGFGFTIDLATGGDLKMYEADFTLEGPALSASGLVVFEETAMSGEVPMSRLHAVDAQTLEARWTRDFTGGAGCAPASDGERVFVHAADGVSAYKLADGSPVWRYERALHRQPIGPVVAGGRVVVQSVSRLPAGHLTALDADTGALLWEEVLPMRALGAPALTSDGLFLLMSTGKLQRRDPSSGALTWESPLPGRSETAPIVAAGLVFVGGQGYVAAFDHASGALSWTIDIDGEATQLSIDGASLLVTTPNGFLHRLVSAP